jgi:hypothetical protein
VMDKLALGQFVSEYFGLPFQCSLCQMIQTHLTSWNGTIGQLLADAPTIGNYNKLYLKCSVKVVALRRADHPSKKSYNVIQLSVFSKLVLKRNRPRSLIRQGTKRRKYQTLKLCINNSIGIATIYGLNGRGVAVRIPIEERFFYCPRRPDLFWGPRSFISNGRK